MGSPDVGTCVGAILAGAFLLLMIRIFYSLVVTVPRRTREIYARLAAEGYPPQADDDSAVAELLAKLAPVHPKDPMAGAELRPWRVHRAAMRNQWGVRRLLVNATRLQQRAGGSTSCSTTILVETRALRLGADVHLVPVGNAGAVLWRERHGLERVTADQDAALLAAYETWATPGSVPTFPPELVRVLLEIHPRFLETARFCLQHGVCLRFGREGWGITTSNEISRQEDMDLLLEVANRVAGVPGP